MIIESPICIKVAFGGSIIGLEYPQTLVLENAGRADVDDSEARLENHNCVSFDREELYEFRPFVYRSSQ